MHGLQTVLLVANELSILKSLKRTLKQVGYQVLMAESVAGGLRV